ncbi:hypothetical protein [Hymenobacter sp. BT730]|uniref:hypothetical protein n=1 Tax=Hymenobacter sp. BT730 TaxID=3063332 RepID=UPI0026DF0214|nr:hypothetical protein [Hymenobacter sp. BT730]
MTYRQKPGLGTPNASDTCPPFHCPLSPPGLGVAPRADDPWQYQAHEALTSRSERGNGYDQALAESFRRW